jgi:hypothetical protein
MTTARISKILKTTIPITIACALLASVGSAMAQSVASESLKTWLSGCAHRRKGERRRVEAQRCGMSAPPA